MPSLGFRTFWLTGYHGSVEFIECFDLTGVYHPLLYQAWFLEVFGLFLIQILAEMIAFKAVFVDRSHVRFDRKCECFERSLGRGYSPHSFARLTDPLELFLAGLEFDFKDDGSEG